MRQEFKITHSEPGSTPITVVADSRDALAWERTNRRGRTVVDLASGASIEDQYDLAFHAAWRTGAVDVARKVFDAEYMVEAVADQEDEDPTKPAP